MEATLESLQAPATAQPARNHAVSDDGPVVFTGDEPIGAASTSADMAPDLPGTVAAVVSADQDAADQEESTIVPSDAEAEPTASPLQPRCGACHQPVSNTGRFCRSCGAALEELQPTVVMVSSSMTTCANCGQEVEEWAQFCRHCGARTPRQGAQGPSDGSDAVCKVCGAPATGGSALCTSCAQAVGT
jgi:Double zinc ribbon